MSDHFRTHTALLRLSSTTSSLLSLRSQRHVQYIHDNDITIFEIDKQPLSPRPAPPNGYIIQRSPQDVLVHQVHGFKGEHIHGTILHGTILIERPILPGAYMTITSKYQRPVPNLNSLPDLKRKVSFKCLSSQQINECV